MQARSTYHLRSPPARAGWIRENFDTMRFAEHQRINHFRNHYELTRKASVIKNLTLPLVRTLALVLTLALALSLILALTLTLARARTPGPRPARAWRPLVWRVHRARARMRGREITRDRCRGAARGRGGGGEARGRRARRRLLSRPRARLAAPLCAGGHGA